MMGTMEQRLDGARAEATLAGALALARAAATSPTWFELSVRALEVAFGERPLVPAPTMVFDLAALLHGERLMPQTPHGLEPLRDALRSYEDHVLARLAADRRWERLTEATAGVPRELRATAVGLVAAQVYSRVGLTEGVGLSTALVRRVATRTPTEVLEAGRVALYEPSVAGLLANELQGLAKAARRTRDLLSDAEVFLVENLSALKGLGPRVALSQLAEAAQVIEEQLPARLRGRALEDGDAPTAMEDDSAYPVGGFSSLSTRGSLENLVSSELIYMEPQGDGADLFDVRFVEGELLYYARDESVAVRRKRTVVLVLDPSLARARVKDAGERFQRLVWLGGFVTALVRKLAAWLDTEALHLELVFVSESVEPPLVEEEGVWGLLLRAYRERGQLELRRAEATVPAIRAARAQRGGRTAVLLLTASIPSGLEGAAAPDGIVDTSGPQPRVHWVHGQLPPLAEGASGVDAWATAARVVLDALLSKR